MNWIKSHKFGIFIFLFALIVRVALFSINFSSNNYDLISTIKGDDGYYEISQGLINGHGFTGEVAEPYSPNPLRPPVWPFLIAFFAKTFGTYWAVLVFELILGSLIPVLGMKVAQKIIGDRPSKYVGLMMVFEPYLVLLSFIFYTETSFTFFFLLFILFLFKYIESQSIRNSVWCAVFLGLAILIKPTVQYFPILIPLALLIVWRKKLVKAYIKHLVAFMVVVSLLVFPWLYRNHQEFGVWGMSAQPAFNLYVYLVPTVLAIDNNTNFATELQNFVYDKKLDVNKINLSNSDYFKQKAIEVLVQHKMALIKSSVITAITFFTHDGMLTFMGYSGIRFENILSKPVISLLAQPKELFSVIVHYAGSPAILVLLMRLVWILITILFFAGYCVKIRKEGLKTEYLAAGLIVLYFMITTTINGLGVNARFRVPVDVFIFSFAIYGFLVVWNGLKNFVYKKNA